MPRSAKKQKLRDRRKELQAKQGSAKSKSKPESGPESAAAEPPSKQAKPADEVAPPAAASTAAAKAAKASDAATAAATAAAAAAKAWASATTKKDGAAVVTGPSQVNADSKHAKLFDGLPIVVSTFHDDDSDNFKDLFGTCKACGAEVSRSVHKKVHALVATPAALKQRTQHVKKAVAIGVPIVNPDWVAACRNAGAVLGLDGYRAKLSEALLAEGKEMAEKKKERKAKRDKGKERGKEKKGKGKGKEKGEKRDRDEFDDEGEESGGEERSGGKKRAKHEDGTDVTPMVTIRVEPGAREGGVEGGDGDEEGVREVKVLYDARNAENAVGFGCCCSCHDPVGFEGWGFEGGSFELRVTASRG